MCASQRTQSEGEAVRQMPRANMLEHRWVGRTKAVGAVQPSGRTAGVVSLPNSVDRAGELEPEAVVPSVFTSSPAAADETKGAEGGR